MRVFTVCCVLILALKSCLGAKMLALMTVPSHSHHHWNIVYLAALAERGHQITYVGVDEYVNPPPNIRHILLENGYDMYIGLNFTEAPTHGPYQSWNDLINWYYIQSRDLSKGSKGLSTLLDLLREEKFDLVIYDLGNGPFILGAVDIVGRPPIVGITAFGIPFWAMDLTATPYPIATSPHFTYPLGRTLSFFERLENCAFFLFSRYQWKNSLMPMQNEIAKKVFGSEIRSLEEIEGDIHINMVNANWATDNPFPMTPGLIPIGGLHIAKPKQLPKDIGEYLDASKDGVIFMSFGSNIQSSELDPRKVEAFLQAFRKLSPLKVLWKWEAEDLPGKPDNVKISKWLPQNGILAHPNVKLFITHGGMLSSQEAVYHGVPILGIPFFVDQHVNVIRLVSSGMGAHIQFQEITNDIIIKAVKNIVENPSYKKNAVMASKIFRDDDQSPPLARAVFWTEYAVRHKGAPHLKPPTHNLSWFHTGLYDIILFALAVVIITLYLIFKVTQLFLGCFSGSRKLKKH